MTGRDDAVAMVRTYLAAMEARDLDTARHCLGKGFTMHFPAAPPMTALEELIAWATPRYRFVRKSYEADEVVPGEPAVVYCRGTLAGEWPDGTPFENVRFLDRFEISDGKIARQDVWNDLAEVRP